MILYSLNSIIQRYGEETVLDIDRLDIESGAIHALLGANEDKKDRWQRERKSRCPNP